MPLTAIPIVARSGGEANPTDSMIDVLRRQFDEQHVKVSETIRMADFSVLPGVTSAAYRLTQRNR